MTDIGGTFTVNEPVELTLYVVDADGDPANADTATCTITTPAGTTSTATVTNPATGTYAATYTPTVAGHYGVYWQSTGSNATAFEDSFNVDDSAVSYPVSLSDVRRHLNIQTDDAASELQAMLNAATSAIEQRVGPLTRRTVTETHDGGGVVMLRTYPVITLTTVTDNGITLTAGQYRERDGIVTRKSGTSAAAFTTGLDGVTITYEAGRTVIPADLRQAVLEQIRHMWETQRGQQRGRRDGDTFVAGQGYTFSNRVLQLIGPFELPSIA